MVVYICTKFHENILDRIKVKEQTQFSQGQEMLQYVTNMLQYVTNAPRRPLTPGS